MRTWRYIRLKAKRRLKPILGLLISSNLGPISGIFLSWLVVKLTNEGVWGGWTDWRIISTLAVATMTWGNSDWLIRAFARTPAKVGNYFRLALVSRSIFLAMALPAILLSDLPLEVGMLLFLLMVTGFFTQSLQVAVVYTHKYLPPILGEILQLGIILAGILIKGNKLSPEDILLFFALGSVGKLVVMVPFFRKPFFVGEFPSISFRYFYLALPFFLHQILGMLQSRVDLYCVSWILKDDFLTGRYQLFSGLLLQVTALAGFVLMPFTKNLLRMTAKQVFMASFKLLGLGIIITGLGLPAIWAMMEYGYGIHLPFHFYLLAGGMILPIWMYAPLIYLLFQQNGQLKVVFVNLGAVLLNIGLNLMFIQRMELQGALLASCISQWFMLGMVCAYAYLGSRSDS